MRTRLALLSSLLVLQSALLLVTAAPARAADEWEALILEGMRRQDVRLREVSSLDAFVREYYLLADRAASGPVRVSRLYLLGRAYGKRMDVKQRDLENARDAYRETLKLAPGCYFAYRDLAILAWRATPPDKREAEADLQKALSYNASYVQALRDLARLCQEQERPADSVVHLRRVIDLDPSDQLGRAYLVLALIKLKRPEEARRELGVLRQAEPQNATFRDLEAQLEVASDHLPQAIAIWKVLVQENPSALEPLWGLYGAYSELVRRNLPVSKEDLKDVVKRLLLLERDPERKKKLQEMYTGLDAPAPDPSKPPDDATLLRALSAPDAELREKALRYIAYRPEPPADALFRGVLQHLGPEREPSPVVRETALSVLARYGGVGTVPLVRLLLRDPAPRVRLTAVLALANVGSQAPEAGRAALLALARFADDPDATLASDARNAVLMLGGGALEPLEEGQVETEASRALRWKAWWASPQAVDVKIRALAVYDQVRDHAADEVLASYLADPDFFVLKAAYEALARVSSYVPDPALRAWAASIPRFLPDELEASHQEMMLKRLKDWLATRPAR